MRCRCWLRDSPATKPEAFHVCLQLLFWENLWAILQRPLGEDRGSFGAVGKNVSLGTLPWRYCKRGPRPHGSNAGSSAHGLGNLGQVTFGG